jgi:hypothetical protein
MSPSVPVLSQGTSLHAVIIMLREVSVMLIVDLSLASMVQHSPFQFHAFSYTQQCRYRSSAKLSFRSCAVWVYVCAPDDHYLRIVKKFNCLLTEMITPQTLHPKSQSTKKLAVLWGNCDENCWWNYDEIAVKAVSKCLAPMKGGWDPEFEPSVEEIVDLSMRYGDSLSSLSLVSSYTEGISLFYLRLGGLTFRVVYSCAEH